MDYASEKLVASLQSLTEAERSSPKLPKKDLEKAFSSFRLTDFRGSDGISEFLKKKRAYEDQTKDIRVGTY